MRTVELGITLAYLGATLGVAMVVPQILRTVRHPQLAGVSPLSWSLTALACTTWMTYGLRTATWPQVPGNVLLVSGAVAIVLLVPSPVTRPRRGARLAAAAALLLSVALLLPAHAVGYLAFSLGLVSAWPQVYDSVSTWRSGQASAVSVTTWTLKIVSQLCWLAYALTAKDVPVTFSALVALSTALSLVVLETSGPWLRRATVEAT